jgi:hypothetical protein
MATLALRDDRAMRWLIDDQRADGAFGMRAGSVLSDDTAVVSLALPAGAPRDRALDHLEQIAGANAVADPGAPPYGWPWTEGAHGWIEPTAWGILALRAGRPDATDRIDDGLAVLRAQECVGGGWNYGTREGFGVDQPPFVQTTSIGVLAVDGLDEVLRKRGQATLERNWRSEGDGLLSVASAAAALAAIGSPVAVEARQAMIETADRSAAADTVALAWASLAEQGRGPIETSG